MSSEFETPAQATEESATISKKQAKKEAAKAEKLRRKQEEAAAATAGTAASLSQVDLMAANYGDVPMEEIQSKTISGRKWTEIGSLTADLADQTVLIRGSAQTIRAVGKKMAFLVLRQFMSTVQCVLTVDDKFVSAQMVKFANGLSKESIVDIKGIISIPNEPIKGTTQQVNFLFFQNLGFFYLGRSLI